MSTRPNSLLASSKPSLNYGRHRKELKTLTPPVKPVALFHTQEADFQDRHAHFEQNKWPPTEKRLTNHSNILYGGAPACRQGL